MFHKSTFLQSTMFSIQLVFVHDILVLRNIFNTLDLHCIVRLINISLRLKKEMITMTVFEYLILISIYFWFSLIFPSFTFYFISLNTWDGVSSYTFSNTWKTNHDSRPLQGVTEYFNTKRSANWEICKLIISFLLAT